MMPPTVHTVTRKEKTFENALLTMKHCKMLLTMYIKTMTMTTPNRTQKYTEHRKIY